MSGHTKAERLNFILKNIKNQKIKNFKIPNFIYFEKNIYIKNKDKIFKKIKKKFKNKKIIIRSSALIEDREENSLAGKFSSFSNYNIKQI